MAIKVLDLELSEGIEPIWGLEGYEAVRLLLRHHGRPIGWLHLPMTQPVASAERIREAVVRFYGWALVPLLLEAPSPRGRPGGAADAPVSVVVCSRDRTEPLGRCLESLLELDHPAYEIVVVDNAPRSDDTARLAARLPVRYVREDRPGLDWARNRGIAEAKHPIVAFTDDDVRVDRGWLRAVAAAFAEPDVMAVTGLVAPAELETEAQALFELVYGGMVQGLRRRTLRAPALAPRELLWTSNFGCGANMSFRRSVFAEVGPFDVALDVGTPSGGAGDLDMLHRILTRGHAIAYQPSALVWHTHRRSYAQLRRQLFDNGRGFGSYLLTCARNGTVPRSLLLGVGVREWLGSWLLGRLVRPRGMPRGLVAAELAGALASPFAYRASRSHARRIAAAGLSSPLAPEAARTPDPSPDLPPVGVMSPGKVSGPAGGN